MLRELALHILDLVENSIAAGATRVTIEVIEDAREDRLTIRVADNGCGMDADLAVRVADPFVTTRTTRRVGLGLPFLKQAAELCGGSLTIDSAQGIGTTVTAVFQNSHIDRMPMGDLPGTMLALIVGNPQTDFVYRHIVDAKTYEFDTRPIKRELGQVAMSEPEVIAFLREALKED
jgi:anti-sigma regulatory factor (Ser/Thr protein kinase)